MYRFAVNMLSIAGVAGLLALAGAGPAGAAADFAAWVGALRQEAVGKGIRPELFDRAFADVRPIPRVIELDRKQPEFTLTFQEYLDRVVPPARQERGRARYLEHKDLLDRIGARYGVQPRFIVALWGIETDFGRVSGSFPVVASLATLAYDGRRAGYFRGELLHALTILNEGHITPDRMMGSWAGAMGQPQFMPSSFVRYAVDADGDGRRDIWATQADVFASAANYLSSVGWRDDQTWGREVRLPAGFDLSLAGEEVEKPLGEWQALGVRRADGGDLPGRDLPASLILPAKGKVGPAYLVYRNYRNLLKWNRSTYFALAVGHLSDAIDGGE
jgi:membrane-bound lytic murein transglycosylase B